MHGSPVGNLAVMNARPTNLSISIPPRDSHKEYPVSPNTCLFITCCKGSHIVALSSPVDVWGLAPPASPPPCSGLGCTGRSAQGCLAAQQRIINSMLQGKGSSQSGSATASHTCCHQRKSRMARASGRRKLSFGDGHCGWRRRPS